MITWLLNITGLLVCAFILAACICRINIMSERRNSRWWAALYVLCAVHALGTVLQMLQGPPLSWIDAAGLAAVALYLWLTRRHWRNGAPPDTNRGALGAR